MYNISATEVKRMLEQTLVPPIGVTELDPGSVKAATSRLGSAKGTAGESYHLRSNLTPASLTRLTPEPTVKVIKDFYFSTSTEGADRLVAEGSTKVAPVERLTAEIASVLAPCWTEPPVAGALYYVDVLVAAAGALWKQVPGRPLLTFEGTWGLDEFKTLQTAIPGTPDLSLPDRAVVFLTGALTRAQYVHGERGYRSMLMSAGLVAGALVKTCFTPTTDWQPVLVESFLDRDVNRLLRNDGVDRAAVAMIALSRIPRPPGQNLSPLPGGHHD